jgi:hypothetical protein
VTALSPTQFREISQVLDDRRVAAQSRKVPQPLIRLWDKDMKLIARIMIPETWECEEIAHDNGMARIEIVGKDNDWLREILMFQTRPAEDLHITIDPRPGQADRLEEPLGRQGRDACRRGAPGPAHRHHDHRR